LSAELIKTHSFRLFFWRFCPMGWRCDDTYRYFGFNKWIYW